MGSRKILAPESLTTGSPAGRTPWKIGDGWLNVQSGLRKGAESEASDSVWEFVFTDKVLAGIGWARQKS